MNHLPIDRRGTIYSRFHFVVSGLILEQSCAEIGRHLQKAKQAQRVKGPLS